MKPIKFKQSNVVFAKDQKEYQPLPAFKIDSSVVEVITCWKMNFWERLTVFITSKVYLSLLTFGKPLMPQYMSVNDNEIIERSKIIAKDNPVCKTTMDVKEMIKKIGDNELIATLRSLRKEAIIIEDELRKRDRNKLKIVK